MLRDALNKLIRKITKNSDSYGAKLLKKRPRLEIESLEMRWLPAYTFDIASATYGVSEAIRYLDVVINRSGSGTSSSTIDFATSNGSAVAGNDYTANSGSLTYSNTRFGAETTKTVRLLITDDDVSEGSETFTLTISNPTNASLGSITASTITISDSSPAWTAVGQPGDDGRAPRVDSYLYLQQWRPGHRH